MKEKLILKEYLKDTSRTDIQVSIDLKKKYKAFKDTRIDTLRRRIGIIRQEYNLGIKKKIDWNKIFNDFEKISKEYPHRPIRVIAKTLSEKSGLSLNHVSAVLYKYRRYGC